MSNPSTVPNESISQSSTDADRSRHRSRRLLRSLKGPAQFVSFWIAIALPFVHVPLLAQGLGDPSVTLTFFALLVVNAIALYFGHGYNQTT